MLSKIKHLFNKNNEETQPFVSDTFDHSKITSTDASQCPFMKKSSQNKQENHGKCPVSGKRDKTQNKDSDTDEQEKPRGGCPFMGGSDKKKNPNLSLNEEGYNQPYVSKFKYYLSANKIDFSAIKKGIKKPIIREVFDNYPIYLQHTLFYNGEDYKKVRTIQCCSRFMAYQELREKGNKKFNKGKYYQALDYYQRAMSLFRWLEYQEPLNDSRVISECNLISEQSIDQMSDSGSKVNIQLGEQKQKQEDPTGLEQLRTQYKQFFVTYYDDNVKYYNGEQMVETPDIDMRKSLLVQIYLNMAAAYIHTHHYQLARKVCDDGLLLTDKVSQLYFRKAQAISLDKACSQEQILAAKKLINHAIQMRPNEKIFATANKNILKMLNLHDSAESYEACREQVQNHIKQLEETKLKNYNMIYQRAKEIHQIQQRMIAQGKTPREGIDKKVLYNTTQMKILDRMSKKYLRVMEFYTQAKNSEQITLAKREYQEILMIQRRVKDIFEIELIEKEGELGGIDSQKIQNRIAYVKTHFVENIYNQGRYNFTMLEWVIKQIVKEQSEEEKQRLEEQKQRNSSQQSTTKLSSSKGLNKLVYLLLLIPLVVILVNMYVV